VGELGVSGVTVWQWQMVYMAHGTERLSRAACHHHRIQKEFTKQSFMFSSGKT